MKFLNLKSKVVDFEVLNLHVWAKNHELEFDTKLINESNGVAISRVRIWHISTFHRDNDVVFYCNDDFEFYEESIKYFPGEVPVVKKLFFGASKVNEDRVEKLLLQIDRLASENDIPNLSKGYNIWKAESCELALAS